MKFSIMQWTHSFSHRARVILIPVVYSLLESVPGLLGRVMRFTGLAALRPQRSVPAAGDSTGDTGSGGGA